MSVTRLVIEERRTGNPDREEALLAGHAAALGIPVLGMSWKPFTRSRFVPEAGDVVAGSVKFVRAALIALKKPLPPQVPYPDSLSAWRFRRIWQSTLGPTLDGPLPVFVRPAKRWKRFTGFVADVPMPAEVYGVPMREPVWCAEVVRFVSEWRCYVVRREVRFIGFAKYGGDRSAQPNRESIANAVEVFDGQPSAYAIDFGVLSTGETALIEVNDGFSVGAYDDVPAVVYWDMVVTRWQELTA